MRFGFMMEGGVLGRSGGLEYCGGWGESVAFSLMGFWDLE